MPHALDPQFLQMLCNRHITLRFAHYIYKKNATSSETNTPKCAARKYCMVGLYT